MELVELLNVRGIEYKKTNFKRKKKNIEIN